MLDRLIATPHLAICFAFHDSLHNARKSPTMMIPLVLLCCAAAVVAQTPELITNVTLCVNDMYKQHNTIAGCSTSEFPVCDGCCSPALLSYLLCIVNGRDMCPSGTIDTVFETNRCVTASFVATEKCTWHTRRRRTRVFMTC